MTAAFRLRRSALLGAVAFLMAAVMAGLLVGPVALPPVKVLAEVASRLPFLSFDSGLDARQAAIGWEIRLPRVLLGALVGAGLAVSGAAYQGVFRNPLADPYLLGVAAGAGLGATMVIVSGGATAAIPVAAFLGGMAAAAAAYALGSLGGGPRSGATLILAGVAVAAFFTAAQTFLQQKHAETVRQVFAWILGRLSTSGWSEVAILAPYVAVGVIVILMHRRLLDVLSVGEEEAGTLGVDPIRVRMAVVAAATLTTAAAVAMSGLIGFVGIIVPHTVRLLVGVSYRAILPLSVVAGAAFLVLADLAARTVLSPAEIPIGVVTAFLGAPFFALVLRTSKRGVW
jgi:iron complex transport system permease protein